MRPESIALIFALLIFELIQQTDAAARIVFRRGSLNRGGAVAQSGLQLQVFGQIHIRLELAGTRRGLLRLDVNALGDVAPRLDAGAGVLGSSSRALPVLLVPAPTVRRSNPKLFWSLT